MTIPNPPPHVPEELVRDYDIYFDPRTEDSWHELSSLHGEEYPDIFWNISGDPLVTPNGSWVITRKELLKYVTQHPELFSSKRLTGYAKSIGEDWDLIPLEVDPPGHLNYRLILNKELSPKAIMPLEPRIREYAISLIEGFFDQGKTEFVSSFGTTFPIGIFFELSGLPKERMPEFVSWVDTLVHDTNDPQARGNAVRKIREVLIEQAEERKKNPTDDLISKVVAAKIDGRPLDDQEIIGMLFLLFIGGQDTVTATMSNIFRHLADNPDIRAQLRTMPEKELSNAVEELLRLFSVVLAKRNTTQDTEINGITIKKGDWLTLIYALGSLDPEVVECPMHTNLERAPNTHMSFAYGPHRCVGSNLARLAIRIAIEEWLKRIPDFQVDPEITPVAHSGVYGYINLPLVWKTD